MWYVYNYINYIIEYIPNKRELLFSVGHFEN